MKPRLTPRQTAIIKTIEIYSTWENCRDHINGVEPCPICNYYRRCIDCIINKKYSNCMESESLFANFVIEFFSASSKKNKPKLENDKIKDCRIAIVDFLISLLTEKRFLRYKTPNEFIALLPEVSK